MTDTSAPQLQGDSLSFLAHPEARPGQLQMIHDCIHALNQQSFHLAAAPTGIGKTAASLAAALDVASRAAGGKTVFFLTSRQTQHRIVVDTVRRINSIRHHLPPVKLVDMIGQAGMCVQEFAKESPLVFSLLCSQARKTKTCRPWIANPTGLKDRILQSPLHVDELVGITKTHTVNGERVQACPWKVAREAVQYADVFVGDYNHLFDDEVRNSSLKAMGISLEDIIIIVDEAHNLPDRIRMSMERRLTPTMIRNTFAELEEHTETLAKAMSFPGGDTFSPLHELGMWCLEVIKKARPHFSDLFLHLRNTLTTEDGETKVELSEVLSIFQRACDEVDGKLGQHSITGSSPYQGLVDPALRLHQLRDILVSVDVDLDAGDDGNAMEPNAHRLATLIDSFIRFGNTTALSLVYDNRGKDGRITVHLLDPSLVSQPVFEQSAGAILMSGTLYPPTMYADVLGIPTSKRTYHTYTSPFAAMRRPVLVASNVTTRYTERSPHNDEMIQQHLNQVIANTPGNVAIFTPSYAMLNHVVPGTQFNGIRIIKEDREWTKQDLDQIVQTLIDERDAGRRVILAGVFGGRLSEGVDYHSSALDTVICIGIPNSPPSVLSNSLKEYAEHRFGKSLAWRYTVSQPAINSILQAMGRPIRAIGDRALIVLLDKRNLERTYTPCFPPDLKMTESNDPMTSGQFAKRFFAKVHPHHTEEFN